MTKRKNILALFLLLFLFITSFLSAQADHDKAENKENKNKKPSNHFMAIPALSFSSDTGFGFGATGLMYRSQDNIDPYKYSVVLQGFATTKGRQNHYAFFDMLQVGGMPLRIAAAVGLNVETSITFCGFASQANCNLETASLAVANAGHTSDLDKHKENYYRYRYLNIFSFLKLRWSFTPKPNEWSIYLNWNGNYYRPGTLTDPTNYIPSAYVNEFVNWPPYKGEHVDKGFSSIFTLGGMYDSRDNEANPTSGIWAETSVRGSAAFTGSAWDFFGYNIDARGYIPLIKDKSLVFAIRGIVDLIYGDTALQQIVRVGSTAGQSAFGGSDIGRGLASYLYPGRIKFINQVSLRWMFYSFELLSQDFTLGLNIFNDLAYIAWDFETMTNTPFKLGEGFGAGVFLVWNERFLVRFNVAFSPNENYSPGIYIRIGHAF